MYAAISGNGSPVFAGQALITTNDQLEFHIKESEIVRGKAGLDVLVCGRKAKVYLQPYGRPGYCLIEADGRTIDFASMGEVDFVLTTPMV